MAEVLVTGGAGFIGSNIARYAIKKGYKVRVLDNLFTGSDKNIIGLDAEFVEGDVVNSDVVEQATRGVKYVFHQAAASSSPMFIPDPRRGIEVNVNGFTNVMLSSAKNKVEKVVYALSSSMYGNAKTPWKESELSVFDIPNLYSSSLLDRFFVAKQVEKTLGVKSAGLAYFSIYGPYESAKKTYANIVTQFLWSIMHHKSPVLYGDGSQKRDFVYVEDVARANFLAAESDFSGDFVNVGTGESYSMMEIAERLCSMLKSDVKPVTKDNPIFGYCQHTLADTAKAKEKIGFTAQVRISEGLEKLIDFYSKQGDVPSL